MGNKSSVQQRIFYIKAGMTPNDVIKSHGATVQQKKLAFVFDSDGVAGYSQREADIFNATTINDKGKEGIFLWTRYCNGEKIKTTVSGDLAKFKYMPLGDVKPYDIGIYKKDGTLNDVNLLRALKILSDADKRENLAKEIFGSRLNFYDLDRGGGYVIDLDGANEKDHIIITVDLLGNVAIRTTNDYREYDAKGKKVERDFWE